MKATIFFCTVLVLIFIGCTKTPNYTVIDENNNGVVRLDYTSIELDFIENTPNGNAIALFNGTSRAIGVQVAIIGDLTQPIFSDSWTFGGNSSIDHASFEWGQTLDVKIVIYQDVSSFTQTLIAGLSGDFWSSLDESWVYDAYEDTIVLMDPTAAKSARERMWKVLFLIPYPGQWVAIPEDAKVVHATPSFFQFKSGDSIRDW